MCEQWMVYWYAERFTSQGYVPAEVLVRFPSPDGVIEFLKEQGLSEEEQVVVIPPTQEAVSAKRFCNKMERK